MATLTKDDLKKTIPEYLGLTGSVPDVTLKLEQDKRLTDLLDDLLQDSDTSYRKDTNNLTYSYLIDMLVSKSPALSLEDIRTNRTTLIGDFRREYNEIESDYTEKGGFKPDLFLKALSYDTDKDGFDRKAFFFRFWRSPIKKVLTYRHVSLGTPEGDEHAKKILRAIFSSHLEETTWPLLLDKTPEHLIEQRAIIEQEQKRRAAEHAADLAKLPQLAFADIWLYKTGCYWSPDTAIDLSGLSPADTCAYLAASPKARSFLLKYIRIPSVDKKDKKDENPEILDPEFFMAISPLTIGQMKDDYNTLMADLKTRNDIRFLNRDPNIPFRDFAAERFYSSIQGKTDEKAALKMLLQHSDVHIDSKALKAARGKKCSEILNDRDQIIRDLSRRKGIRALGTVLGGAALIGTLLGFAGSKPEAKQSPVPKKAPVQQVAKPTQNQATKPAIQTKTQSSVKTPQSAVQKPAVKPTAEKPQQIQNQTSDDQNIHVQLRPLILPNNPVYLEWQTFRDLNLQTPDPTLPSQLLRSFYWSILDRIEKTGRTCAEFFDSAVVAQSMRVGSRAIFPSGPVGHESPTFYFNPKQKIDGRSAQAAIKLDLINYAKNLETTLTDLPADPDHKAKVQALALRAFGPAIGWSQDQQQIWQAHHPEETQQAYQAIGALSRQIMKDRKIASNDSNGVTLAVLHATARYRQDHPDYQAYSLVALDTALDISNGRGHTNARMKTQAQAHAQSSR